LGRQFEARAAAKRKKGWEKRGNRESVAAARRKRYARRAALGSTKGKKFVSLLSHRELSALNKKRGERREEKLAS